MNKRSIFVVIAVVLLFIITGCTQEEEQKVTDAYKFKEEYEALNNQQIGETKLKHREVNIPDDNPFVYATANDILGMMDNNESFVVYFGFSSCPWCRSVLPTLIEVSEELKLEKIYYVDVKDIRNKLKVDENGAVVVEKEGSEGYYGLLKRFDNVLADYELFDEDDELVEDDVKRLKIIEEELKQNFVVIEGKVKDIINEREGRNLPIDDKVTREELVEIETYRFLKKYKYDQKENRNPEIEYQDTTANEISRIVDYIKTSNVLS